MYSNCHTSQAMSHLEINLIVFCTFSDLCDSNIAVSLRDGQLLLNVDVVECSTEPPSLFVFII